MSMQQVTGATVFATKSRIKDLQATVKKNELFIQDARDAHSRKRAAAAIHRMTPAEYLALNSSPVIDTGFVAENAEIATKKTAFSAMVPNNTDAGYLLKTRFEFLINLKNYLIEKYNINVAKPERALAETEFLQLYPVPVDADFATQLTAISTASTELSLLLKFLQSGPQPQPAHYDLTGLFDTSFLVGTTIVYP